MKKNKQTDSNNLDHAEKALLSSFENDEWRPVKNLEKEKSSARKIAAKSLRKDVRIPGFILNILQTKSTHLLT